MTANKFNFNKLTTSRIDSRGTSYDYDSMMHYGSRFFSTSGKNTIQQTKNSKDQRLVLVKEMDLVPLTKHKLIRCIVKTKMTTVTSVTSRN